MFTAISVLNGWIVFRAGNPAPVATFKHLATVKQTVAKIGGTLSVVINGYEVN